MESGNPSRSSSSVVFPASLTLCLGIALWATVFPDTALPALQTVSKTALGLAGDAFLWSASAFFVLLLGLAASPIGKQRLGPADSRPDFSTPSWLSMLFAAGMGTGLVVWGIAEPLTHHFNPPSDVAPPTSMAFILTNLHWGFHAWGIYAMGALILAYFGFVKGQSYLPSSPIRSEFSGAWVAPVAAGADILAIMAVAFGVAGSIAMGTMQVHSGLTELTGVPAVSMATDWGILLALFVAYMASSATGLDKGIRILSNLNMLAAIGLLVALFWWGGPADMMASIGTRTAEYVAAMPVLLTHLNPYEAPRGWFEGWTLVYMVWWVAWTPFVGIFIARISKGRTIREFVLGVMLVPTLFSALWFGVFGQVGLNAAATDPEAYKALLNEDVTSIMFAVFDTLPAPQFLSGLATVLASIFLVTSVDSATFVLGMLTSDGALNPKTSRKWVWGVVLGLLGAGFTMTNNIDSIKALLVAGSVPFLGVLLLQLVAFGRSLWRDRGAA